MSMLPYFDKLEKKVVDARDKAGVRPFSWPPLVLGLGIIFAAYLFFPGPVGGAVMLAFYIAPIWLPFLIIGGAWSLWLIYIRSEFIASRPYVLLEIKIPRDLVKTPLAMETVLTGIHFTKGESNWFQKFWQGSVRPYWSFEIASFEGQVHFFVWTRGDFRKLVENAFYSQYPGIQLIETVDYTRLISGKPEEWSVWGCDYKHTRTEDVYPIKTYVDFGLDKVQKEPEQVDPFAQIVEFMGSIGKGEYLWLQFIARMHGGEKYGKKINAAGKQYTWRDQAEEEIEKIRKRANMKTKFFDPTTGKMVTSEGFPNPTKGQMETIAAIDRNAGKLAYDVGGRCIYIADNKKFNSTIITGMIGLFKVVSSEELNGIKATHFGMEFSDYPWEIGNERRKDVFRRRIVEAYRRRQYFHEPFKMTDPMVMSVEELATVFHVPSRAVETPGLGRISSATSEAPPNLPT
jgi:hypothetical protein